jgi:striatin 1/3/4
MLVGHSDAVWEIELHETAPLLISASADGSLKLWDIQNFALKSTYWFSGAVKSAGSVFESPTSVCWNNSKSLLASYKNSIVNVVDVETRSISFAFDSNKTFGLIYLIR